MLLTDGRSFIDTLYCGFDKSPDEFMDFYNSIRDGGTKQVYKNGIIYPPLANMFFYFCSKLISPDLISLSFKERFLLREDVTCRFIFMGFLFLSVTLIVRIIQQKLNSSGSSGVVWLLSIALVLSYPVIYCIQRGNILLLAMAFSMFFVFFRNDERQWVRELSLIALAIAAGLKLYPAIFGLLLLKEKDYKRTVRLVVYGLVFTILPFFFYDGIESVRDLIANLQQFDSQTFLPMSHTTSDVFAYYIAGYTANLFHADFYHYFNIFHWILFIPTMASAIVVFFLTNRDWQKVFCLCYVFMNLNSSGQTYILVFMLIPFVLFLIENSQSKNNCVYFVQFSLLLIAIPVLYYKFANPEYLLLLGLDRLKLSPNELISAPVLHSMLLLILLETISLKIKSGKNKKHLYPDFKTESEKKAETA